MEAARRCSDGLSKDALRQTALCASWGGSKSNVRLAKRGREEEEGNFQRTVAGSTFEDVGGWFMFARGL